MPPLPRANCSHCRLSTALRKGGEIREHVDPAIGSKCPGSGRPPWSPGMPAFGDVAVPDRDDVVDDAVPHRDDDVDDGYAALDRCESCGRETSSYEPDDGAPMCGGCQADRECEPDAIVERSEISPGLAAQVAQEQSRQYPAPSSADELHRTAQAGVYGAPGVQVDGQFVSTVVPLEGLKALRQLRELVDDLERQLVGKCRERQTQRWDYHHRELHSWAEISDALGVPKNTLHRRHGPGGSG